MRISKKSGTRALLAIAFLLSLASGCLIDEEAAAPLSHGETATSDRAADNDIGSVSQPIGTGSCVGACGRRSTDCWCNKACETYGDCCNDYGPVCVGELLPGEPTVVTGVSDGDTVRLTGSERVRLDCVDAPESNQPYGYSAASTLRSLLAGQNVRIERSGRDRYGRTIGTLYVGTNNINRQLILDGAGWNYDYYCGKRYQSEEDEARKYRRGLWNLSRPIAPWNWRRGAR